MSIINIIASPHFYYPLIEITYHGSGPLAFELPSIDNHCKDVKSPNDLGKSLNLLYPKSIHFIVMFELNSSGRDAVVMVVVLVVF